MAHLLGNDPGQQDAGEILLSGFTQIALQMEAQRRLMKPGSKPRRGKKGQKKQPQRGLGVAQLEKIRLEEQRRASQQMQQLTALRQLHSGAPLYPQLTAPAPRAPAATPAAASIDNNHKNLIIPAPSVTSSGALPRIPSIDSIASSFLLNNASPLTSIASPSTPATPLDLFPREKLATTGSVKAPDRIWMDRNSYLWQVPTPGEGGASVERPQSLLSLAPHQSINEGQDGGGPSYPFSCIRQSNAPSNASTVDLWHPLSQAVRSRTASPPFTLERMMELSSFQSAMLSRGDQVRAVTLKRQACGVVQPGGQLSEVLPLWLKPSVAHSKPSQEYESHGSSSSVDVCELTLRPPGEAVRPSVNRGCQEQLRAQGPSSFLSLAVGATWQDSVAESAPCSSTPSPLSAATTKSSANDTATDGYMSPPFSSWSSLPNIFTTNNAQPKELQVSLFSSFDVSLDLTLKL